ncbi:hypothetical protein TNCV_3461431 [Trichonephila clavipes]|nr:hypothetical protein TNCV_3461431 [Trichonephila clavipes]
MCVCPDLDQPSTFTSEDINVVAKRKISNQRLIKPTISGLNYPGNLSSTFARLRKNYFKDMKISPYNSRS